MRRLNVTKPKEIVADFPLVIKGRGKPNPLVLKGRKVEVVHLYIHMGTILDDRQDHTANTRSLLEKGNQRIHFAKKLKSFSVCSKLLELLYRATVESTVAFNSPSFSGGQREGAQLGYALQDHQYS